MKHLWWLPMVLAACGRGGESDEGPVGSQVPVQTAVVVRDTLSDVATVPGRILPIPGGRVVLASPTAGTVTGVPVQIGSLVAPGDTLVLVDAPDLAAQVVGLGATAGAARRDADRIQNLFTDGIAARRQLDEALATAQTADAAADAARVLFGRTRPVSPMAGAVEWVRVQAGEHVDAGAPLVSVVRTDTVDFVAAIPADLLRRVTSGILVQVTQGDDATASSGVVVGRSPAVDSLSGAGQVVVRLPNRAHRLVPGSAATARIRLGLLRDVLIIPSSALVLVGDSMAVFVVMPDSTVTTRHVTAGIRNGDRLAVTGSLAPGDRVVTVGAYGLADGMRVVPRDSMP